MRRIVVKGELGGSPAGRKLSAAFFIGLWVFYIAFASLYQLGKIEFELVEPPGWYICTKDFENPKCTEYCALERDFEDPACKPKETAAEQNAEETSSLDKNNDTTEPTDQDSTEQPDEGN